MNEFVAAVLWIAAFACFVLAGIEAGSRFADRVKWVAYGLACFVLVHGYDAVSAAFHK